MLTVSQTLSIPTKMMPLLGNQMLWRMKVEHYHKLIEEGAFLPHNDVELIHGVVIKKMSKNPPHSKANQRLLLLFIQLLSIRQGWFFMVQDPITLTDSEPEPDLAIARGTPDDYVGHPGPHDVGLVIEVADSSLDYDKVVKHQLYAFAGINEYWIVNLPDQQLEVYTNPYRTPTGASYRQKTVYLAGDEVGVVLDGDEFGRIQVSDIFPPS